MQRITFMRNQLNVQGDNTSISLGYFMGTKHLYVFVHTRKKDEVYTVKMFKPSSNFLTDCSKTALKIISANNFRYFMHCRNKTLAPKIPGTIEQ